MDELVITLRIPVANDHAKHRTRLAEVRLTVGRFTCPFPHSPFGGRTVIWLYPLLELLYSFLLPIIYLAQLLTKKRAWK
jgi:hypothetical protein